MRGHPDILPGFSWSDIEVDGISSTIYTTAIISGFTAGDKIVLAGVAYNASDKVSVNSAGVVTVSAGGQTYNLNIADAVVGATNFSLSSATSGGTILMDAPSNASLFADIRDPNSFAAATSPASTQSGFSSPTTSADTAGMALAASATGSLQQGSQSAALLHSAFGAS